ncbi:MAG: MG2 domain-containing protein, partial [Pseudomonadota bacterium]
MASIIGVLLFALNQPVWADQFTVYAYRDFSSQGTSAGSWAARINFSAPVYLVNLKQALKVLADGKEIDYDISMGNDQSQEKSSRTFVITPRKINPQPTTISLRIKKGLSDVLGSKTLAKPFIYDFLSVEQISVTGLETYFKSTNDRGVKILLSRSVSENDLRNAIKIDPGVHDLKIRRNDLDAYEISGNFIKDQNYIIQVLQVPANGGTSVFAQNEFQFAGPGLNREIAFQSENSILELRSRQLLPVRLSGVSQIRCELSRIPPILIAQVARDINQEIGNLENYLDSWRTAIEKSGFDSKNNCFEITEFQEDKEVFFAPEAADKSVIFSAPMSFRKSPEKGGAWFVKFAASDDSDVSPATRLIQATDLAISYKISTNSLLLWVTSLHTGEPVQGVDIAVVTKNGEAFDVGESDENGLVLIKDKGEFVNFKLDLGNELSAKSSPLHLENISWLVAANKDDSCAVDIESFKIKPTARASGDKAEKVDGTKTGLVFTDRAIYRPGDEVHFKFISRMFKDNTIKVPEKTDVKIQVIGPRGDVYYSRDQSLNEFGSCWDTLKLETYWPVGNYTIKSVFSNKTADKNVFTKNFSVQEYRESRHYVSLTFHREQKPLPKFVGIKGEEEFLRTEITSTYFAGGPVRHGKVRWKADLAPVTNSVPGFETYFFGNQEEQTLFLESGESILDEQGKLSVKIPLD